MTADDGWPQCAECGAAVARTTLGDERLCDRCLNERISVQTGWPKLPDPPGPEEVVAGDGRRTSFRYRLTWAPSGVLGAEAEQVGAEPGDGYRYQVLGKHDEDPAVVLARLRSKVRDEVGRAYLEPADTAPGWHVADLDVAGRVTWSGDASVFEPSVVIDGRPFDWSAFGRMVATFEGWEFSVRFSDGSDEGASEARVGADETTDDIAEVIPLHPVGEVDGAGPQRRGPSIDAVLAEFLAEQQQRLAASTFRRYEGIVGLLRSCLNGYGHQSLSGAEADRWRAAFDAGDEEAFTRLCDPQQIVENYGEFLGYFMIRKVAASQQELKAAATVTKKLARWLAQHDYIEKEAADDAHERAADAGRDLPRADKLGEHLFRLTRQTRLPADVDDIADEDWVEDYLEITRVEDGRLWFGEVGPVAVPEEASDLAEVGWDVNIVLARVGGRWQVVEVGMVYP